MRNSVFYSNFNLIIWGRVLAKIGQFFVSRHLALDARSSILLEHKLKHITVALGKDRTF